MIETERITVVSCRSWPVVGAGQRLDDLAAVVVGNRVTASSRVAHQFGVTVGLRRREAQRRAPGLTVLAPDPAGEARFFEPILRVLDDITPRIEIDRPGLCSFLSRGPSRYFGGDEAMSQRVAEVVNEVLKGRTTVHVGTADSRFAALRAASLAPATSARVIPPGASAAFVSPLPVTALAADADDPASQKVFDDLVDVLQRLGLSTVGGFAALSVSDVTARFGAFGVKAHRWAQGHDHRPSSPVEPAPELEVAIELDPPVERVDQAAFVAKALADEFIAKLADRGVSCARVAIVAETEHGEQQMRLWRSEEAFGAPAISDRMRWQLDGWLSGPARQRPTGGLSRLVLRPDDLSVAAGRQLGFWGEQTGLAERAARAIARVQGLAGAGAALVPEVQGGRSPGELVVAIPAESVDVVERATRVDRDLIGGSSPLPAVAGVIGGATSLAEVQQWPGQLPAPAPTMIYRSGITADVLDQQHMVVAISGRGLVDQAPAWLVVANRKPLEITGWSGPWLLDEHWWRLEHHHRKARMQLSLADGRALVVSCQQGQWSIDAAYD